MVIERNHPDAKQYEGGSYRDRPGGRGLFYEMPAVALRRLGVRYELGQNKYGKSGEFKKGLPVSDCYDSMFRHMLDYIEGDNSEDHLAAIVWNAFCMMLMESPEMADKWQDLPQRKGLKTDGYSPYPSDKRGEGKRPD